MIIDIHAHLEPRILPLPELIRRMDQDGVKKTFLISHLTNPPETKKAEFPVAVQRFMFYHRPLRRLAFALTKSMYRKKGEWNLWLNKISSHSAKFSIILKPDNSSVVNAIAQYPGRFNGWIFVNPGLNDALETIDQYSNVRGMIGIKIHPFWHHFSLVKAEPVIRRAGELKMPVLIHLGFEDFDRFAWLPEKYNKVNFIFAHLGIPFYADLWRRFMGRANVFFDVASTYHVDACLIQLAVKMLGARRILFGTDAPYGREDSIVRIKQWIASLPVSDGEKAMIFFENSRRIFRL